MKMHAKLVCLDSIFPLPEIGLSSFPTVIGRGGNATIRIEDRWLSRQHCEIDQVDGRLVVRDLGSKHGTYVNGYPVTETALNPGDKLHIGLYKFQAEYEPSVVAKRLDLNSRLSVVGADRLGGDDVSL